jgi:hypothetical protein
MGQRGDHGSDRPLQDMSAAWIAGVMQSMKGEFDHAK